MDKYFSFSGTSTRSEYWGVTVIMYLFVLFVTFLSLMIGGAGMADEVSEGSIAMVMLGVLMFLGGFGTAVWINLATSVRRCRDAGINVMWTLAQLVPYIGVVAYIVIGCLPTEVQPNAE